MYFFLCFSPKKKKRLTHCLNFGAAACVCMCVLCSARMCAVYILCIIVRVYIFQSGKKSLLFFCVEPFFGIFWATTFCAMAVSEFMRTKYTYIYIQACIVSGLHSLHIIYIRIRIYIIRYICADEFISIYVPNIC